MSTTDTVRAPWRRMYSQIMGVIESQWANNGVISMRRSGLVLLWLAWCLYSPGKTVLLHVSTVLNHFMPTALS